MKLACCMCPQVELTPATVAALVTRESCSFGGTAIFDSITPVFAGGEHSQAWWQHPRVRSRKSPSLRDRKGRLQPEFFYPTGSLFLLILQFVLVTVSC